MIIAIVVALGFAIGKSMEKPSIVKDVWENSMTIGNLEAKNYFVVYSDLGCPYCVAFENAILDNETQFLDYIAKNDVLVEIRLSDYLYHTMGKKPSHLGAIATFCAKGKELDYYKLAMRKLNINNSGADEVAYWTDLGSNLALGTEFEDCVENERTSSAVLNMTAKTIQNKISGMPYFKFNRYTASGFNLNWGYEAIEAWFDAGLKS